MKKLIFIFLILSGAAFSQYNLDYYLLGGIENSPKLNEI